MRTPFGFVTKQGAFIDSDILKAYALKQGSQQIKEVVFPGTYGLVTPLYSPDALAYHLETNTYHARCVKTKAQDVGGLGWRLQPLKDEDPSEEQKKIVHDFFDNLDTPLEDILTEAMIDRESIGQMALELIREDRDPKGKPVGLHHIPVHTIRQHIDEKKFIQIRGIRKTWFKAVGLDDIDINKKDGKEAEAGTIPEEVRANELIWDKIYTPRSDYYGIPDHIPAIGAILGDVSRCDYNVSFFQNYGVPAYAVCVTGDFDPGVPVDANGKEEGAVGAAAPFKPPLQWVIEEQIKTLAENPHSVVTLFVPTAGGDQAEKVDVKFEPISVEIKDASFRLYRKDNRDEVLSAHAVPPYRAGISETGALGGSTVDPSDKIYRDSVIAPRQRRLERIINKEILQPLEVTDWAFELINLDLSDEERELDMALKLFDSGALTPNDLIRNFGEKLGVTVWKDVPAMDSHYVKGQPIDLDIDIGPDVEDILKDTQKRLIEVVAKNVDDSAGNGSRIKHFFEAITGLKGDSSKTTPDGAKAK